MSARAWPSGIATASAANAVPAISHLQAVREP
jgi:hypothetical protein